MDRNIEPVKEQFHDNRTKYSCTRYQTDKMYHGPKCYSTNCVWRKKVGEQKLKGQSIFELKYCMDKM